MSLSGPDALRSLDEALRDVRREEDDIAKRVARSAELVAKLRETESELLRDLAKLRLDPAMRAELGDRLGQAELKARDMLARHGDDLADAEAGLRTLDAQIAALAAERAERTATIERGRQTLKALADKVAKGVEQQPDYAEAQRAAKALAAVAAESLDKTSQAEADRETKGRPYRDDPLFMYLWERGYGTRNYRENNLVSYLDGLVARMVGFVDARANFAMLNEIPLRLREHAEHQQQLATAASNTVMELQKAALDAAGGKAVREAVEAAIARIAAIDEEAVTLEDRRDEQARQQRELAQGADPAFSDAIASLADVLGREDIKTLVADARMTRTGQDDTIVQQLDDLRQRAAEEEADTREQRTRLKTLAARRRELEDIQYEFKKQGFDNPRSSFGEDRLVGDMLNEFLRGGITATDYWGRWRGSQNWTGGKPAAGNPWGSGGAGGGGFQWPDSSFGGGSGGARRPQGGGFGGSWGKLPTGGGNGGGANSSGGGFSRPRTGSSGNRTSGGFKTGGGF